MLGIQRKKRSSALLRKPRNLRIWGETAIVSVIYVYDLSRFNQKRLLLRQLCAFSCLFGLRADLSHPVLAYFNIEVYPIIPLRRIYFFCLSYLWRNLRVLSNLQVKQREVNQQYIFTRMESFVAPIILSLSVLSVLLHGGRIWVYYYNGTLRGH